MVQITFVDIDRTAPVELGVAQLDEIPRVGDTLVFVDGVANATVWEVASVEWFMRASKASPLVNNLSLIVINVRKQT